MKRQPSRAPSPTPTAFSGISNYRTDSYRPIRDKNVPAVPQIDYRLVSKTHFDELSRYLAAYLARAPPNSRSTARQKLTRLTIQQFHELSTDVYDELVRRQNETEVPFLPLRSDFHPKRNQARQKLATLPTSRFEDLSSDVYFELSRRYPEFKEDPSGSDDYPAPDFPKTSPPRAPASGRVSGRTSADRPGDSGYGGSVSSRRPSEDRRRPSEVDVVPPGRRSEDSYRRNDDSYGGRTSDDNYAPSVSQSSTSRRKPSQDTTRDYGRRPSAAVSSSGNSDTTLNPSQSTTATSAMIIPNKSTIEEEYIKVPYGRERESGSTTLDERERSGDAGRLTDNELDSASDYPMSPQSPPAGLSGLSARLKGVNDDDDDRDGSAGRAGDDFYDKYGRSSVNSDRSAGNMGSRATGRTSTTEDQDKMKRDYEYKIATMQTQIANLQRDLGDAEERERRWKEGEARVKQMEEELASLRRRAEEQSSTMRALQKELDELREDRQREAERAARRAQEDEEELQILRDRCERLEEERENRQGQADMEIVDQLKADMEGLLTELGDLARRNDELMTAKDADLAVIRDLDQQLKDYKRKYEQAKTELRNVKATSQLYVQAPKFDRSEDQLPVSPDGGVADIHITAFLSAVDALLTAGRSNAPTRVLTPMKSVVNSVTAIVDDVRAFERRPQRDRADVDVEALRSLRERLEATLSNLVAASKTHATSLGMSPVSLLDAAASHVSASITEIGRTVCIRKATKAEQDHFSQAPYMPATATNGFSPSLRSVDETKSSHQRKGSSNSVSSRGRISEMSSTSPPNRMADARRRPPSDNSSSEQTNSPPPIFDQPGNSGGVLSDDSTQAEGSEDAWSELKPYLEAQTESIVYAIQSVLSGVRSPTPSPTLNENLTQIITIVSSIVAVCNDNIPPASSQQGNDILRELSDHANKLSEVQALPEVTKESRQIMAKSSFAIANAMKALTRL
ncbi:putative spa2 homology domain (SHD) of GIT [Lyophyllum shimeji]|uniref:Spa2 homology domain (SHD) of GIT n=1 Tax=Lyophyllum shimeji TaxID=47721 RepID=A0A9P3PL66_LYOSH|nr:putative spa2 homology domain (SHD) of GIT [Lyophyllum shimeji]